MAKTNTTGRSPVKTWRDQFGAPVWPEAYPMDGNCGPAMEAGLDHLAAAMMGRTAYLLGILSKMVCESEIERAMLVALVTQGLVAYSRVTVFAGGSPYMALGNSACGLDITLQHEIGKYRADFMVLPHNGTGAPPARPYVIECDGHDYHERTKAQAARDRKRDREMQALGYGVLRFTGAQIWEDPMGCAREVVETMDAADHVERLR